MLRKLQYPDLLIFFAFVTYLMEYTFTFTLCHGNSRQCEYGALSVTELISLVTFDLLTVSLVTVPV